MQQHSEGSHGVSITPPALGHATLTIGRDTWELYVFGVTRIGRDMFVQLTLLGPREVSVTIRARSAIVRGVTARQILDTVCDWLSSGGHGDHAYLELPDAPPAF